MVAYSGDGKRHDKRVEVKCEDVSLFCFVQRKDISKPWFNHTLSLKRLGVKIKKQDCGAHACNKVLPITDNQSPHSDKLRSHKRNAISRMTELVKWAASAKGPKSGKYGLGRMVMNFKNKATSRDGDQVSNESPKISFNWDMVTSSAISSSSRNVRPQTADALNSSSFTVRNEAGNWITTDSEFVVLEL